jgi:hypothetical protein
MSTAVLPVGLICFISILILYYYIILRRSFALSHNDLVPKPAVEEYPERRRSWLVEQARMARQDATIAYCRLAIFGAAAVLLLLSIRGTSNGWWLLLPLAAFVPLLKQHERVIRAREGATRLAAFYERGMARLEDRWIGTGDTGERFLDDEHIYAADLDLFGRGSLFELLSLARTRAGGETLAAWLKAPAPTSAIVSRHAAVSELRPGLELREALTLAGGDIEAGVHPDRLNAWATAAPEISHRRALVFGLTLLFPTLLTLAWINSSLLPLIIAFAVRAVYEQREGRHLEPVLRRADSAARDLDVLRPALTRLERESFSSPVLLDLQGQLRESRVDASAAIRRLTRLVEMHDWAHNILFGPIAAMLMWNTHLAYAVERWRATHGAHVPQWLHIVGEFEALASLAAYSYEHPNDPLPEIVEDVPPTGVVTIFEGQALGHPLLPEAQMIRNDVQLTGETQLLVVSGSNMSGKSTLLRTVGINAVMALAGAPVRARSLRISPLAIGATLRIQDSLQQGRSRFFAEITRIRQIVDAAANNQPLLFLLDELFHGTNSHDRLTGATGVLRTLLDRGAIGLITTHDLALTAITRDLGNHAANVHFEDTFDGSEMQFDYRMKAGPVTRSNAIALMRAVGLDIREDPQ